MNVGLAHAYRFLAKAAVRVGLTEGEIDALERQTQVLIDAALVEAEP